MMWARHQNKPNKRRAPVEAAIMDVAANYRNHGGPSAFYQHPPVWSGASPVWWDGRQRRFSGLEAQVGAPTAACSRRGCKSCHCPAGVNCGQAEPISSSLPRVPEARQLLHSYQPLNSQCFMPRLRVFNWCKGDDGAVEWRLIDLVMTMSVWSRLERDNRRESPSGAESQRRGEEEAFIRAAGRTNVLHVVLLQRRVAVWGSRQRLTAACNFDIWRSKTAEPPLGSDILSMQSWDFPWSTLTFLQK